MKKNFVGFYEEEDGIVIVQQIIDPATKDQAYIQDYQQVFQYFSTKDFIQIHFFKDSKPTITESGDKELTDIKPKSNEIIIQIKRVSGEIPSQVLEKCSVIGKNYVVGNISYVPFDFSGLEEQIGIMVNYGEFVTQHVRNKIYWQVILN